MAQDAIFRISTNWSMSMDDRDLEMSDVLDEALAVVQKASKFILGQVDQFSADDIEVKELNSLVSYVDKEAEDIFVKGMAEIIDGAGFVTEEDTKDREGDEYTWVIDPLDGTTNFLNRIPHFAVSVGLRRGGEVIMGIVKEVTSGEEWTAIKGQGARLDGQPIKVSSKPFANVTIATGFPYANDGDYDAKFEIIKHWLTHTYGMRRMGSAALDLCYVASGRLGAYHEDDLNPWDVAAGTLIVTEAGGIVSDFEGGDTHLDGKQIIASAPHFYDEVLQVIKHNYK